MRLRHCIAATFVLAATGSVAAAAASAASEPFVESIVELRINDQAGTTTLVVRRDVDGTLLLRAADLPALRLRAPARGAVQVNGERYYRLGPEFGAVVAFDEATQSGQVTLPPQAFLPTRLQATSTADRARPQHATPGGFVNYDVFAQHDRQGPQGGGLFELGLFGHQGVVTGTMAARFDRAQREVVRLDTTWTRDFPDRLATLRVGDAISTPGAWGHAVRVGGLQFGTNFSTQPTLVTTPLLAARGEAVVPSTVDVFVNNRPVASEQVPPGPFTIDHLPVLTGAGQLQVVVTDTLGRQQVITQPYYSGTALLRGGLAEYGFEVGSLREDYGASSFAYGDLVGSATWRRGISDTLTTGARFEAQADGTLAAGVDAAWQAGQLGVVTGHLVAGGDTGDAGYLAGAGIERSGTRISAYAQTQFASAGFRQVGMGGALERAPRQRTFAGLGFDLRRFGNLQFAYGLQTFHDADALQTLGLSYSVTLGSLGYLGLFASHATSDDDESSVLLTWTLPLGERRTLSSALQRSSRPVREGGGFAAFTTLQRDLPSDTGFGYRLMLSSIDEQDASVAWQGRAGVASLDYAQRHGMSGVRLGGTGALAVTSAGIMPARRLDQSFAVVQVADYEGLHVYLDNQPVGRTDAHGRVLVDALRAYERNEVSVDPVEVPMDGAIAQTTIVVTPAFRSGAVVTFPVTRAHAATMRLVQADGTVVPAGAVATLGDERSFPVALDGMLYLEGLEQSARVRLQWQGGECSVAVRRPAGNDPVPDLGTVRCR